jgi:hypothetical protein
VPALSELLAEVRAVMAVYERAVAAQREHDATAPAALEDEERLAARA